MTIKTPMAMKTTTKTSKAPRAIDRDEGDEQADAKTTCDDDLAEDDDEPGAANEDDHGDVE
eukprot:4119790-Pyramimonas_sp.AAC.1